MVLPKGQGMRVEEAERHLKDYLLHGIAAEIVWAEEAYALAETISQHRQAIRAAGYTSLFGSLQLAYSDRQTLSVTKIFDRPTKKYPTRSIRATLDILKTYAELWTVPQWHVLHETLIEAGAESTSVERLSNVELTHAIVGHYEGTLVKLAPALSELRESRNKIIAHNEAIDRSTLQPPTWGAALSLVEYAKDFVSTIGCGYLNTYFTDGSGRYLLTHNAQRTSRELQRLLEAANISA
jgi:hypothetical protein